jgi:hypothetical protein
MFLDKMGVAYSSGRGDLAPVRFEGGQVAGGATKAANRYPIRYPDATIASPISFNNQYK